MLGSVVAQLWNLINSSRTYFSDDAEVFSFIDDKRMEGADAMKYVQLDWSSQFWKKFNINKNMRNRNK